MKRTEMAVEAANEMALRNERTKLDRVTLPAAYRALAKDCLKQKRHLDCAPELVEQLRSVVAELKLLTDSAKSGSPDQIRVNKAKSAASSPNDKLGVKRDRLLAKIGQAIYGLRGSESGPADVVAPIQDVFTRLAEIDSDLARVSQPTKGAWIKIQRLIIGCGIVAMLVFCVLIATLLIGARAVRQSLEAEAIARKEEAAKDAAAAIALYEPAFLQMLKDGDAAWESGEKGDAVQHYTQLLAKFCGHGQQERTVVAKQHLPEMARAAGRSIDFLADSDIDETAKQLIKKAEQSDLVIAYTSAKANRLVKEVKADQAKEDRKTEDGRQRNSELSGNRKQEKELSGRGMPPVELKTANRTPKGEHVKYKVSKGLFKGELTVELSPSAANEMTLKDFVIDRNRLVFLLTVVRIGNRRDPWHYTVFDEKDTRLESGLVMFSGAIGAGDKVKSHILIGYDHVKPATRVLIDTKP